MARTDGRHRVTRRTKIATGLVGLALAASGVVVATTAGDPGTASADPVDKSFFVDITTVAPNVKTPQTERLASKGTFTVNCGKNENGHFNPDNFIAQPGVRNGAQHLHDYVGNLTTNADSNNKSLLAGGTTCKNGDKSAYFWPVVRIDTGDEEESNAPESPEQADVNAERDAAVQDAVTPRVDCPDVASRLEEVPDQAMDTVDTELGNLDQQAADANAQMAGADAQGGDPVTVLNPLRDKRKASIDKIAQATGGKLDQTQDLAACGVKDATSAGIDNGDQNSDGPDTQAAAQSRQKRGHGGKGNKPPATTTTAPGSSSAPASSSSTSASSSAPASSSSAAATTTSASELPGVNDNNEVAGNDGEIQRPATVALTFRGSPVTPVRAMPQFLRVLSGDAKEGANGPTNARAAWTCTGFENRLIDKYPICPEGSKVERIHDFPSCWDGKNIDSANHRTHIVFPDANGRCGRGFVAVPQLRVTLTYDIPHAIQVAGQYKVDSFPEEHHNPLSDHDDFANVMSQRIMWRLVTCVNFGRTCNE
ncbi:DUF1996 domain-containing protein [Amycolatopsis acidiphila]|uniref:DUF1996 domain-containing protein n=1 Tax=Amycolatopsis acidiphila TaxID=715473 RepID=A0A557ZYZ4_9PSEU|nr:DUF1996 domain-containing protein [Amycolatopsis acidiphila]TVT17211.1 DUF1996 domain-containing protein [Amycolatopsis acidiphila]UIJ58083.1 DUF1996 domain-containing protein [Amycolatopsis acidiphila]GHG70185.1 hypothetical protein GCM10017788_30980 [Amycolatopsis acidiphila]